MSLWFFYPFFYLVFFGSVGLLIFVVVWMEKGVHWMLFNCLQEVAGIVYLIILVIMLIQLPC